MAGVLDDPPGFPYTPPGVDVLEGGKLTSNNVAGSSHDPLQSFAVASGAVSKPGGDAAGQDALHSAGVEGSEDAGAHSKLPQPSIRNANRVNWEKLQELLQNEKDRKVNVAIKGHQYSCKYIFFSFCQIQTTSIL